MTSKLNVIVACSDARKAGYHMALAFYESDELDSFVTTTYMEPKGWIKKKLKKKFPRLASRYLPGLPSEKVCSVSSIDFIRNVPFLNNPDEYAIQYFDKVVSRKLNCQTWLLSTLDCCSIYTIERAKKLGIKIGILCVAPSNHAWDKIRKEELNIHPSLADSKDVLLSSPEWIKFRRERDFIHADLLISYSPGYSGLPFSSEGKLQLTGSFV